MRVLFETLAICGAHVDVIDAGDLQLEALVAVGFESIHLVQHTPSGLVRVAREVLAINGESELGRGHCDGQLKLLVDDKRKASVTFLGQPTAGGGVKIKIHNTVI